MDRAFELVLRGHPDKVCDLVAHRICQENKNGRNAIECMWGNRLFVVSGETDCRWYDDVLELFVKGILKDEIGLLPEELGYIRVVNNLNTQSVEINEIVGEDGAGDNGIFFGGYHRIYSPAIERMKKMCEEMTREMLSSWGYRTDGKFIFTVDEKGKIKTLSINIASFMHIEHKPDALKSFIQFHTGTDCEVAINPRGEWIKCFGFADCGVTGRKLACDGSCGLFSHGGGAMFGKDFSKADITVPLYLSQMAKSIVSEDGIESCELYAHSIIGDKSIDVFHKDTGELYQSIPFSLMGDVVSKFDISIFGLVK